MKILITGVFGFIGQNLYQNLKCKHDVKGIGRDKKINKFQKNNNLVNNIITNQNLISLNFQPDVILHCAGSGSVSKSYKNKKIDYNKNVITTKNLLKFINSLKNKPLIILFSSAAIYGNHCLKYKKKIMPISPYGKNKLLAENILKNKSTKKNFKLIILRFYSIYGLGLKKQLIWDACNKITKFKNNFFGSGKEIRSWINIIDVVNLIEFILKKKIKKNITLDVASNDVLENYVILKKLFILFNLNKEPEFNNLQKKGDPIKQIYNNNKLKKIGWNSKIKLSKGLKDYVLWFKKNLKK